MFVRKELLILLACANLTYGTINISVVSNKDKVSVFNVKDKEWIVNEGIKYKLRCESNVSVKWTATGHISSSWMETNQNWNWKTNAFIANLNIIFNPGSTGYVICDSTSSSSVDTDSYKKDQVYIYVKGKHLFREAQGLIPIHQTRRHKSCLRIVVPCILLYPIDSQPILMGKSGAGKGLRIHATNYSRKIGFSVDLCMNNSYTQLTCVLGNESAVYNPTVVKMFQVFPEKDTLFPFKNFPLRVSCLGDSNATLVSKGGIFIDQERRTFLNGSTLITGVVLQVEANSTLVCSDSINTHEWKIVAPNITGVSAKEGKFRQYNPDRDVYECHNGDPNLRVRNLFCENVYDCELKSYCLKMGTCTNYIKTGVPCLDKDCLKIDYPFKSGIFECSSSAGTVRDVYFTGLNRGLYLTSQTIPSEGLINILEVKSPFYYGIDSSIYVICEHSLFTLVRRGFLSVNYKNGTSSLIPEHLKMKRTQADRDVLKSRGTRYVDLIAERFIPTPNMTEVVCQAKLSNGSNNLVTASRSLEIIEATPPVILNEDVNKVIYEDDEGPYYVNCRTDGTPKPTVTWRRVSGLQNDVRVTDDDTFLTFDSTLQFDVISFNMSGEYECSAFNGYLNVTASKIFRITVERKSPPWVVYVSCVIVGITLICSVLLFLHHRQRVKNINKYLTSLSNKDISEFFIGVQNNFGVLSGPVDAVDNALKMPYNNFYEVDATSVQYGSSDLIGKGTFGLVYKGVKAPGDQKVAIKTAPEGVDICGFKTILSEIKILIYLGFHPNIVEFVGAVTKNIDQLQVQVLLEYCPNGDMLGFLRRMKKSALDGSADMYSNLYTSRTQLVKWCSQIAFGMEHLSKRNVIHGDLATRNILLDDNLNAKITDFGLSTKSVAYSVYVRQGKQAPLPWRWMGLESLTMYEFSCASDIWSFGVTMWEIFSFGEIPYPGETWNELFIQTLRDGNRLHKPKDCPERIYQYMMQCWMADPKNRPNIKALKKLLETELRDEVSSVPEEQNISL